VILIGKKDILLLTCKQDLYANNNIPLGLAYLCSYIPSDYRIYIYDNAMYQYPDAAVVKLVSNIKPGIVGISGLVGTYRRQKELSKLIKMASPGTVIVSGGGCASLVPKVLLDNSQVDVAVMGEGERTFPELIDAITHSHEYDSVDGVAYRQDNEVVFTKKREPIKDLNELRYPSYDMVDIPLYFASSRRDLSCAKLDMSTSRGCPFQCRYCAKYFDRYREQSAEYVFDHMKFLVEKYDVERVTFIEDNFMVNKNRVHDLCDMLISSGLHEKVEWGVFGRVDLVDVDVLKHMKAANCCYVNFGIESADDTILKNMNKGYDSARIYQAMEQMKAAGFDKWLSSIMYGYPGETVGSVIKTMELLSKYGKYMDFHLYFTTPYPNTKLWDEVSHRIQEPVDTYLDNVNYKSFNVNLTDMQPLEYFQTYTLLMFSLLDALRYLQKRMDAEKTINDQMLQAKLFWKGGEKSDVR